MYRSDVNGSESLRIEKIIEAEQVEAILKSQTFSLPSNTFIAASTAVLTIGALSVDFLIDWMALIIVGNWARLTIPRLIRKRTGFENRQRLVLTVSWIGALISGLSWSIMPFWFWLQAGTGSIRLIAFMLAGVTAGGVVQGTAHAGTPNAFLVPIMGTVFLTSICGGTIEDYVFAANVLFYSFMLVRSAGMAEANFRQSSRLRHGALASAAELEIAHAKAVANGVKLDGLANRDSLTGLANRGAFAKALDQHLEIAAATGAPTGLLLLDLDNFKGINDTLGHGAGDLVLMETAARLKEVIGPLDLPARLGGDEFALMMNDPSEAERVGHAVLESIGRPMLIADRSVDIGISIGLARYPQDAATASALMANADLALYAAKENGRHRLHVFDTQLQRAAETRRDVERDLTEALRDGSIEVWFQPQVCLVSRSLVGAEALLRWNHPRHGWIAPPTIVAAAMSIHHAEDLTAHVLTQACGLIQETAAAGRADVIVAVNVSPRELGVYSLRNRVAATLAAMDVEPGRLELEITEEAFIANKNTMQELNDLKDLGVRLSIDDFGTGYSSFAYLSQLRVDRIKIDRCFVTAMAERDSDRILVQAILGLGHKLGLEVVAEGVERLDDVLCLIGYGCRLAQGYYFGKPMTRTSLLALMAPGADFQDLIPPTVEYSRAAGGLR